MTVAPASTPVAAAAVAAPRRPPRWLGLLLVLPALVLLAVSYVEPTVWTVRGSFQRLDLLGSVPAESVGTDNYRAIFDQGLGSTFWFALSLGLVPVAVAILVALPLAWAANRGGTATRWATRGVLAVPLAVFTPTALAAGWFVDHPVHELDDVPGAVRAAVWLTTAGLAVAVGVTLYLAALRRDDASRRVWPAVLTVGALGLLAGLALALQQSSYLEALGVADPRAATPLTAIYFDAFAGDQMGAAAAAATLLLAALGTLGLLATLLVVLSGLRLEVAPAGRSGTPAAGNVVGVVGVILGLVLVLGVAGYGLWPWLHRVAGSGAPSHVGENLSAGQVLVNTWLPPLLSTSVGILAALLAAIGIGAVRPLGGASEWLLVPFGFWLFVGSGPLTVRAIVPRPTRDSSFPSSASCRGPWSPSRRCSCSPCCSAASGLAGTASGRMVAGRRWRERLCCRSCRWLRSWPA